MGSAGGGGWKEELGMLGKRLSFQRGNDDTCLIRSRYLKSSMPQRTLGKSSNIPQSFIYFWVQHCQEPLVLIDWNLEPPDLQNGYVFESCL